MDFQDIAEYFIIGGSLIALVPALIGLMRYFRLDQKSKALCLVLVGLTILNYTTLFQAAFNPGDNRYLSHLFALILVPFGYFGFVSSTQSKGGKTLLLIVGLMVVLSVPYVVITEGFRPFNYLSFGLACGYVSLSALTSLQIQYSSGKSFFWVAAGSSLYFLFSCLFFSFYEYYVIRGMLDQLRLLLMIVNALSIVSFYIPALVHFIHHKKPLNV